MSPAPPTKVSSLTLLFPHLCRGYFPCVGQRGTRLISINKNPGMGWAGLVKNSLKKCSLVTLGVFPLSQPITTGAWLASPWEGGETARPFLLSPSPWYQPGRGQAQRGFCPPATQQTSLKGEQGAALGLFPRDSPRIRVSTFPGFPGGPWVETIEFRAPILSPWPAQRGWRRWPGFLGWG